MRASLRKGVGASSEIQFRVASDGLGDDHQAWLELGKLRDGAPAQSAKGDFRDRATALFHLWKMEADEAAFACNYGQLLLATTVATAELAVSRSFERDFLEARISESTIVASTQIAGYWSGHQLGLIKFAASAALADNVKLAEDSLVPRSGWGLFCGSNFSRLMEAMGDPKQFPSSLRLLSWRLGPWPDRFTGTPPDMPTGWLIHYFPSFGLQLPLD